MSGEDGRLVLESLVRTLPRFKGYGTLRQEAAAIEWEHGSVRVSGANLGRSLKSGFSRFRQQKHVELIGDCTDLYPFFYRG